MICFYSEMICFCSEAMCFFFEIIHPRSEVGFPFSMLLKYRCVHDVLLVSPPCLSILGGHLEQGLRLCVIDCGKVGPYFGVVELSAGVCVV